VVNGIQGKCMQQCVYPPGIPAFGFPGYHVPVFRRDAQFRAKLAKFTVYGTAILPALIRYKSIFYSSFFNYNDLVTSFV